MATAERGDRDGDGAMAGSGHQVPVRYQFKVGVVGVAVVVV